jgi:hypothetical protein
VKILFKFGYLYIELGVCFVNDRRVHDDKRSHGCFIGDNLFFKTFLKFF